MVENEENKNKNCIICVLCLVLGNLNQLCCMLGNRQQTNTWQLTAFDFAFLLPSPLLQHASSVAMFFHHAHGFVFL